MKIIKLFKKLFKKQGNVIDANIELGIYKMSISPTGKLLIENKQMEAFVIAAYELNNQEKQQLNFSIDKTVLDVKVYGHRKKQ